MSILTPILNEFQLKSISRPCYAMMAKKFSPMEIAIIDANIGKFFTPDYSEDSSRKLMGYFKDTLDYVRSEDLAEMGEAAMS
jgi:hypothetical protein